VRSTLGERVTLRLWSAVGDGVGTGVNVGHFDCEPLRENDLERGSESDRDTDPVRSAVPVAVSCGVGSDVTVSVSGNVAVVSVGVGSSVSVRERSNVPLRVGVSVATCVRVAVSGTVRDVTVGVIGSDGVRLRSGVPERVIERDFGIESDALRVSVATAVCVGDVTCVTDFHVKFFVGDGVSDIGVTGYVAVKDRKQRVSLHSLKLTFE
jgi:hypothetical protein